MNDDFKVVPYNLIVNYDLKIYSRWGQLLFNSADIIIGWDGNYKNIPAEIGTYITLITYEVETFEGLVTYTLNGTVTLLR